MTAKSFRELVCWQLLTELRRQVRAFLATSPARGDYDYCRQIRKSSRSPSANIAEGFGRSDPTFRRHLDIALGSLQETEEHLDDGLEAEYLSSAQHLHLRTLTKRAWTATKRLKDYLERSSGAT